jgi:DNA polymerase-3 subunit delta'
LVGEWKSCVIVSADRLQEQASNAFLKTLEEPAGRSLFLLLTDSPQFLLPTIASRCQEVVIGTGQSEAPEPWRSRLLEIMAEEMDFGPGPAGGGSPLAGLARAARVGRMLREVKDAAETEVEESLSAGAEEEKDVVEARIAARYREIRSAIMRSLMLWYRDILLLVCKADEGGLRHREFAEVLRRRAAALDCRGALRNVDVVETMHRQMERNLPDATVLGWGFGDLSV